MVRERRGRTMCVLGVSLTSYKEKYAFAMFEFTRKMAAYVLYNGFGLEKVFMRFLVQYIFNFKYFIRLSGCTCVWRCSNRPLYSCLSASSQTCVRICVDTGVHICAYIVHLHVNLNGFVCLCACSYLCYLIWHKATVMGHYVCIELVKM